MIGGSEPHAAGRRAVFLDRDGVLNEAIVRDGKPYPPRDIRELKVCPDATAALHRLKQASFLLIVVTNQPDVSRGTQTREAVEIMHAAIRAALPIDEFFVCWHDDKDACECRKPKPGLLVEAASRYSINVRRSFLIGDRWRDVDAGSAAGCRTVQIDRHYNEKPPQSPPDCRVGSLTEAVNWILGTLAGASDHQG
jgi:D-glycero-D-manno-heptose 1,7-bisphosphate phosphatase